MRPRKPSSGSSKAQHVDAKEAHTLLRAVLADSSVGQRLVEDHMIVTATMVQLRPGTGPWKGTLNLGAELSVVQAAAEEQALTYRDLLTAAQQAHGTLRDRVIELQGKPNAVSSLTGIDPSLEPHGGTEPAPWG